MALTYITKSLACTHIHKQTLTITAYNLCLQSLHSLGFKGFSYIFSQIESGGSIPIHLQCCVLIITCIMSQYNRGSTLSRQAPWLQVSQYTHSQHKQSKSYWDRPHWALCTRAQCQSAKSSSRGLVTGNPLPLHCTPCRAVIILCHLMIIKYLML